MLLWEGMLSSFGIEGLLLNLNRGSCAMARMVLSWKVILKPHNATNPFILYPTSTESGTCKR